MKSCAIAGGINLHVGVCLLLLHLLLLLLGLVAIGGSVEVGCLD